MTERGVDNIFYLFAYICAMYINIYIKRIENQCFFMCFPLMLSMHFVSHSYIAKIFSFFINNVSLRHANKKNCELYSDPLLYRFMLYMPCLYRYTLHWTRTLYLYVFALRMMIVRGICIHSLPLSIAGVHHGMQNHLSSSLANLFCI